MPNLTPERTTPAEPGIDETGPMDLHRFNANVFFALFDDRYLANAAADRVRDTGVESKTVEVLAGKEGMARLEPNAEPSGLFNRLAEMAQELSDFKTFIGYCHTAVKMGKAVLVVSFEEEAARTAVELIVREAEGAPLAYTDNWTLVKYS